MSPSLPAEIWAMIVKHAITRPWHPNSFNPPIDDLQCVEGFAEATPEFKAIVDSMRHSNFLVLENNHLDYCELRLGIPHHQRVRHLECRFIVFNTVYTSFFEELSKCTQLISLSMRAPQPYPTIRMLETLPFAPILRRLDFMSPLLARAPVHLFPFHFQNLVELRLKTYHSGVNPVMANQLVPNAGVFINELLVCLSGCRNLQLLSVHVALDIYSVFEEQRAIHQSSLDHLVPSEGYERHYADCPLCTESYDHDAVARGENFVTRYLALALKSLSRVMWANAWLRNREDEEGQRGTNIIRKGTSILLSRDDGRKV
ncbi:hypothetical protein DFH11DRAFT_1214735 [Phellopilus nigrolimitatus]|nr:hypothetical protein DFH11DRAFT_1214735 [Phellopilus nigrolimitatus]